MLKVTANCDVGYYASPELCTVDEDGVSCADEGLERCASAIGLTIVTVDRAVHVKRQVRAPPSRGGGWANFGPF